MHKIKNYGKKLNEFYSSNLGELSAWFIKNKLREIWKESEIDQREKIISFGFNSPYKGLYNNIELQLTPFKTSFENEVISEFDKLPLRDASIDRILAIHPADHHEFPEQIISEFWRVLEPEGKLIFVVVNENGFWKKQIANEVCGLSKTYAKEALSFNKFYTSKIHGCLFFPPVKKSFLIKPLNVIGRVLFPSKCGVLIFEAEKKIFAPKGRLLKITPSLKDLVLRPRKVANAKDIG